MPNCLRQHQNEIIFTIILSLLIFTLIFLPLATGGIIEQTKTINKVPLVRHPTILLMLQANNTLRKQNQLKPHKLDADLCYQAQVWAEYMAKIGKLQHSHLPWRENIAYGQTSVTQTFADWYKSGGHQKNILSNTTYAGFGMSYGKSMRAYWCAVYSNAPRAIQK